MKLRIACLLVGFLSLVLSMAAQTSGSTSSTSQFPRLVKFSGTLTDVNGSPLSGIVGVTFALYSEQSGGAPLWLETQNVQSDKNGHYTVMLGATKLDGAPVELFASEQAQWLGVQPQAQPEQPRAMLVSVPYALKAVDAETLGGRPASAYALATPPAGTSAPTNESTKANAAIRASNNNQSPVQAAAITGSGATNYIPRWSSSTNLGNSVLFQSGSGSTAKIGINTTTPGATLDVKGGTNLEGTLNLPATGTATAAAGGGKNSQPLNFAASSYNSSTASAVNQTFQWEAEATGNDTATPSATLNLRFGSGTSSLAETGLKLSNKGLFTFAGGQTFPGTPRLAAANTFTGNQTVNGVLSVSGGTASVPAATFTNSAGGFILEGRSNGIGQFVVDGGGNLVAQGSLFTNGGIANDAFSVDSHGNVATLASLSANSGSFAGNGNSTIIGDPGCGSGFAGIGFGALAACANYALDGNGTDTYLNSTSTGSIHLRNNGNELMTVNPLGALNVTGNASQNLGSAGFVKAMVYYDPSQKQPIVRCYNSQLGGAAATTPPCGITISFPYGGNDAFFDLGFEVDNRFVMVTPVTAADQNPSSVTLYPYNTSSTQLRFDESDIYGNSINVPFYFFIY
jgi:trimeric autotransporter adhesin